jgi:hypothetical protein
LSAIPSKPTQFLFGLLFLIAHRGARVEILVLYRPLFLRFDLFNLRFERLYLGRLVIVPMRARDPASSSSRWLYPVNSDP